MDSSVPIYDIEKFNEDFEVVKKGKSGNLGAGGFGSVHLVEDMQGRNKAVKRQMISGRNYKVIIRREVQTLWDLRVCQQIVELISYYEGPDEGLLVMEYLSGGELFARCCRPDYGFTEQKCKKFVKSILEGLSFLHSRHIIHLDIKPQNIMFQNRHNDNIKLIDFGMSKKVPVSGRIPSMQAGTYGFMSPEVVLCSHASPFSDMWCLGVVVYMMVSGGIEPFWQGNAVKTQRRTSRGEYTFSASAFSRVSDPAKHFIANLLELQPKKRLTAVSAMGHEWFTAKSSRECTSPKILDTNPMRGYLARRRWVKAITAVRAVNRMKTMAGVDKVDTSLRKISAKGDTENHFQELQKIIRRMNSTYIR